MRELLVMATVKDWFDPDSLHAAEHLLRNDEKLYYITPDNFLLLAKSTKKIGGSPKKNERLDDLVKQGGKLKDIPFLRLKHHINVDKDTLAKSVSPDTARVWGHEGRHRNMMLKQLGFHETPVIVKFQEMKHIPKYVINQDGTKIFEFRKMFKSYR